MDHGRWESTPSLIHCLGWWRMGRVWAEGRHLQGKTAGVGAAESEDGLVVEGGSPAKTTGARRQCRHGGRPTGRSSRSNCSRWSARRTASSAAARTVKRGSCTVAGGEFGGRRLLSSSNPQVPMCCSPRLDCSSFFAGGVLVHCSSLRVLDEHCRLRLVSSRCVLHRQSHLSAIAIEVFLRLSSRFNDLLGCCICNSVLLFMMFRIGA
ncbi:uncharacterized protein [Triticum aestivum]|uniref:uncharacterized protein isoform X3 n=1 Tax=Triticum aestivum TaxID=4565 RepID=UPI001D007A5D|nr:uncharacterized protein LOC123046678 isoform X3 [Triticum aestivum]